MSKHPRNDITPIIVKVLSIAAFAIMLLLVIPSCQPVPASTHVEVMP